MGGVGRALGGRWEGVGRALGGRWRVVRVRPGSLIYRQIKSLHCSGYLLVHNIPQECPSTTTIDNFNRSSIRLNYVRST